MGDMETRDPVGDAGHETCAHPVTSSTVIAGMRRVVCEACGHVSVEYVSDTVRLVAGPDVEVDLTGGVAGSARRGPRTCFRCRGKALFITPLGLGCTAHAWEAAAEQEAMGRDLWIPIRIDS